MIVTVDAYVMVIALYAYRVWHRKDRRWLIVYSYAELFGEKVCSAVSFWYVLTGCNTVSQFLGRGKPTAWKAWKLFF